ncbi:glycosyltransferase family 2 protein [Pigmentibacter ruber]|uniref:glycosyltransferase family 2 protein n=1 Tax=Pigmentibacter ruber TaxID=2683196 RepID=UPI00131DAB9F|nr:glycosyltransferase family 2 protein [Pigmentibacter ruber]
MSASEITFSVVIPAYNESETLQHCYKKISPILEAKFKNSYEIIFVDDGSKDQTYSELKKIASNDSKVKCIILSRNFGKEAAMSAGLLHTTGNFVSVIDCDLQDPPEIMISMYDYLLEQNCDVVYGVRTERLGETFLKKLTANLFYRFIGKLSIVDIPRNTGDFRVMKKEVVAAINELVETQRFMKGIFAWVGFNQIKFEYKREARVSGTSKFNFIKLWNFALEGITSFTDIPLKVATYIGFFLSISSIFTMLCYIIKYLIIGDKIQGFLTLLISILFIGGVQLMFLGILGEYLGRTFFESKRRPIFIAKEKLNIK